MNTSVINVKIREITFFDNSVMSVHLSNNRTITVPLDHFPTIQKLSKEELADFEIIDGVYLSFLAIDEVYSLDELVGIHE